MEQLIYLFACLLIAMICIVLAIFCRTVSYRFQRDAVATEAVVTGFTAETVSEHARPLVRFKTDDGMEHTLPSQNIGNAAQRVRTGTQVKILYTQKKAFGRNTWNIFIVTDAERARPYLIYDVIALVLLAVAVGMAFSAYAVWHG